MLKRLIMFPSIGVCQKGVMELDPYNSFIVMEMLRVLDSHDPI